MQRGTVGLTQGRSWGDLIFSVLCRPEAQSGGEVAKAMFGGCPDVCTLESTGVAGFGLMAYWPMRAQSMPEVDPMRVIVPSHHYAQPVKIP